MEKVEQETAGLWTIAETQRFLRVGRGIVIDLAARGEIKMRRFGKRKMMVFGQSVRDYLIK